MKYHSNISSTIGSTPLVRLNRMAEDIDARILCKLEFFNPLGSVKDRIAASMIEAAEVEGLVDSETLIVEPTSGNTGIALAFICAAKNYRLCLTMPDTMSQERRKLLKHHGAELVLTPGSEGMGGAIAKAREILESEKKSWMPNQFANPANPRVHRERLVQHREICGAVTARQNAVGEGERERRERQVAHERPIEPEDVLRLRVVIADELTAQGVGFDDQLNPVIDDAGTHRWHRCRDVECNVPSRGVVRPEP